MFMFCNFVLPTCRRPDITEGLKSLKCRTLIFVGDSSPFHSEALHMTSKLDRRFSALVEVCSTKYYLRILVWCNCALLTPAGLFYWLISPLQTKYNIFYCWEFNVRFFFFFWVQNIPEFHIIHNIQIQCLALHLK